MGSTWYDTADLNAFPCQKGPLIVYAGRLMSASHFCIAGAVYERANIKKWFAPGAGKQRRFCPQTGQSVKEIRLIPQADLLEVWLLLRTLHGLSSVSCMVTVVQFQGHLPVQS